jgi:hypothetical protein
LRFGQLYNKVAALDVHEVAVNSINETKDVIADLNVEQLNKGIRSDGSFMPDYSHASVELFGKPAGPIKLFDTGAFYRGFEVKMQGDKVIIDSTDNKTDLLFKKYATKKKNIFGLSGPYRREYIDNSLRKAFRKNIKQEIGI